MKPFFDRLGRKELTNQKLLTEFILKRVGVGFRPRDYAIEPGEYLPTKAFQIKVWPDELARFLIFLYEHKGEINSFLEFGTGSGGTFFVIDSYLRAINPDMGKSVTIDKQWKKPNGMEEYQKLYPVQYTDRIRTDEFELDQDFDLCFLDASHLFYWVKYDYEKVKDRCKFIAFHDILTANPKKPKQRVVKDLWPDIEADHKIEIVTDDPRISFMSGFGIIWND